jgi:hypothetical protein
MSIKPPTDRDSTAHTIAYVHGGLQPYSWPRPDGAPDSAADYASASRMLGSFSMHWNLAGGYWPTQDVVYRSPGAFLPAGSFTVAEYADHLCRLFHAVSADAATTRAIAQAIGEPATKTVDASLRTSLAGWLGVRAIGAVLDHPRHLTR